MTLAKIVLYVVTIFGTIGLCECIFECKRKPYQRGVAWCLCANASFVTTILAGIFLKDNEVLYYGVIGAGCFISFFLTVYYLEKDNILQILYAFCIQFDALMIIIYLGTCVSYYWFNSNIWIDMFIRVIGFISVYMLYILWFRKIYRRFVQNHQGKRMWIFMLVLIALFTILIIWILLFPVPIYKKDWSNNITVLLAIGALMVTYIGMIAVLNGVVELNNLRFDKQKEEAKKEYWEAQVKIQNESFENARRTKHDLRHHVNVLREMLQSKKYKDAVNYLEELGAKVEEINTKIYCKNFIVNCLLSVYVKRAEDAGININTDQINIPEKLDIDEMEVAGLLANLIENATEACMAMPEGSNKFINVVALYQSKNMRVSVENSCVNNVVFDGQYPISTKTGEHGIGTRSVAKVATKYNGMADFSEHLGVFTARVILNF